MEGLQPQDFTKLTGHVILTLLNEETGEEKKIDLGKNTVTVAGDAKVADAMSDAGGTLASHAAAGSTSGGKTTASNALEAELGRVALDSTTQGAGADDNDVVYVATFPAGTATGAWVELGLFNGTPAGDMFLYQEFAAINKTAAMVITVTWTWTFGAS